LTIPLNQCCPEKPPESFFDSIGQKLSLADHAYLAAAYANLRRDEEARAAAAEVLRLQPDFSIRLYSKQEPYKDSADLEHLLQGFHKAGLPE
jgi:hypothetical protein